MKRVNLKDFQSGIIRCESCNCEIRISDCQPLSMCKCPQCATLNFVPYKLGPYWLYQPLGGGGMGRVYKAISENTSGEFAIKLLPGTASSNSHLIQNLYREAQAGIALGKHKNIISIIEYGQYGNDHYVVSEFVEGERLDRLIETKKTFDEKEAWSYALQIIEAEKHIISKGYLFRDLKPENILIQKDSTLKLYDYGLCIPIQEAATGVASSDEIEGSPFYLPPERVVGAPEGEYSEIYSLGMIVFHMLAGRTYYSEAEIKDLISKHVTSLRISSVETHLKHCHRKTIEILDKMIKRRPHDRYHSFDALKADILECLSLLEKSSSIGATKEESDSPKIAKFAERKSSVSKSLIILIPILIVLSIVLFLREYRKLLKVREARQKIAASLGISLDIAKPDKSIAELKSKVDELTNARILEEKAKLPKFDEEKARREAMKTLSISSTPKKVDLSLEQIETLRKSHIEHLKKEKISSLGKFDEEKVLKLIIKEAGLTLPLPSPEFSAEKAIETIKKKIEEEAKEKFSPKKLADELKQITENNRAYRRGEMIKIVDKTGQPFSGIYEGKKGAKIIVGDKEILISDLPAIYRWKFDEAFCEKKTIEETEKVKKKFEMEKQQYINEQLGKRLENEMKKMGFIKDEGGNFISAEDYVRAQVEKHRNQHNLEKEKWIKKISEEVESQLSVENFYKRYGYCKYKNKWMSESDAVNQIIEEKRKAHELENSKLLEAKKKQIQQEIENKIFTEGGYVFYNGKWEEGRSLLDRLVELETIY